MTELAGESDAYLLFERLRWGGEPTQCPHCGVAGHCRYLPPTGGRPRRTRTGAATDRRVWRCGRCRRQFSVLTGTVFEGTRVPLPAWAGLVSDVVAGRPGDAGGGTGTGAPSAATIARRHGVSTETARTMVRRLRAAGVLRAQRGAIVIADDPRRADAHAVPVEVPPAAERVLRELLRLDVARVRRVRAESAPRRRPRSQDGPSADYA